MIARDELLEQFLIEGRELAARGVTTLAALMQNGADNGALDDLFRTMHTLKGSAALFDLPELTALLHAMEARLEAARRDGRLASTDAAAVERALDIVEAWLDALDQDGAPSDRLRQDARDFGAATHDEGETPGGDWARDIVRGLEAPGPMVAIRYRPSPDAYFRGDDPLAVLRGVPGLLKLSLEVPPPPEPYDPFHCALHILAVAQAPLPDIRAAIRLVADQVELAAVEAAPGAAPTPLGLVLRSLRVDAERLDHMAALIDELVIAKNALLHQTALLAAAAGDHGRSRDLANTQAVVERVVTGLHAAVTDLRLVALTHVFGRLPRQVRDIADALGKAVELSIAGERVAVDKSVVEKLFEPLLHLVRNAIDHGVEPPEERRRKGKRERAHLTIAARTRGDEVTIDVADDGRGIDVAKVKALAVGRGVVDEETAAGLTDAAAANLIFAPGFSTASALTEISGRGVGMDAVRAAVTQIGGRVLLENRPGHGLSVRLVLPAHVVLTKILVVKAGGERFGVPLESVAETHRVRSDHVTAIRAGRAYVRRDNVIPLLRLSDLLGVGGSADDGTFPVLKVRAAGEDVGIQIDEIAERVEAPLRPMGGLLADYPGVLGTVLQGDGQVLLVLDLAELAA